MRSNVRFVLAAALLGAVLPTIFVLIIGSAAVGKWGIGHPEFQSWTTGLAWLFAMPAFILNPNAPQPYIVNALLGATLLGCGATLWTIIRKDKSDN